MLSLFQRKRPPPTSGAAPTSPPPVDPGKGLMRPETAASLLATPRQQKLLEHIWQRTSLSRRQFATLYLAPLERYAELVQHFPASESHHHAGLLYARLLDPGIFDWLAGYPDLWAALLYVLAGQYEHAGTLGELVVQADQASVAQELGGDPSKALAAPKHALQRKLLDGLRFLLREEFKLNQPQASDGWLTQDALWLVSKTVSDKLRAHLLQQGIDGIPASNTAVFNVLQDHGIALPTPDGKAIWKATVTSDTGWSHSFTLLKLSPVLIWEAADRPAPFAGQVRVEQEQEDGAQPATPRPASFLGLRRSRLGQLGLGQGHQVGGTAFQRTGNSENHGERRCVLATLDLAHVRALNAGDVRQGFLGDALAGSHFAHGGSKRDGGFGFVGCGSGGSAFLYLTLFHWQKRRTSPRY